MIKFENEACDKSKLVGGIVSVIDNGWGYVSVVVGLGDFMAVRRAVFCDGRKMTQQEIWEAVA